MNLFNQIQSEIGTFSFLFAMAYMLLVSLSKLVFDNDNIQGHTRKLANNVLILFLLGVIVAVITFDYSKWYIFKAVVTLSCIRFWYDVGLHYFEKAYTWFFQVLWSGVQMFYFKFVRFWKDFIGIFSGKTLR